MPFNMNFTRESLSGKPPIPAGWHKFRVTGFKPKVAGPNKDSVSFNPQIEVIDNPELDGSKVFENLNSKAPWIINDFVHGCGMTLETVQDGNEGTEAENKSIPGFWLNADTNPDEPEKWEYQGPLMNAVFEAESYINEYNGKKSAKIKQYKCAVPGCTEKHSTNLGK
jgi:hypothetical protein